METMVRTLISPESLFSHLDDPAWVIIDCRFDLTDPSWGIRDYQVKHIPGAIYAHLDNDLSGPVTPLTGRHPLPDMDVFADRLGGWGISNNSQVIVYDTTGGAIASRLWWMLRYLGHSAVAILDGGFGRWEKSGFPVTSEIKLHPPSHFEQRINPDMMANIDEIDRIRNDPDYCLVDARTAERYRGEKEPIDPVAGHIPGAINRFHGFNLDPDGSFKPADVIKTEFNNLIGDIPPENVTVYCGSGVTSCHHLVAMEIAGLSGAKLYPGSWSEWIRNPDRPVARNNP